MHMRTCTHTRCRLGQIRETLSAVSSFSFLEDRVCPSPWMFKTHYVDQLALNTQSFACFCLQRAGIKDVRYHGWRVSFSSLFLGKEDISVCGPILTSSP